MKKRVLSLFVVFVMMLSIQMPAVASGADASDIGTDGFVFEVDENGNIIIPPDSDGELQSLTRNTYYFVAGTAHLTWVNNSQLSWRVHPLLPTDYINFYGYIKIYKSSGSFAKLVMTIPVSGQGLGRASDNEFFSLSSGTYTADLSGDGVAGSTPYTLPGLLCKSSRTF